MMDYEHDLTGWMRPVTGIAHGGATAPPYCFPEVDPESGAELVILPHRECEGCRQVQREGHQSYRAWRLEDGAGDRYAGPCPWDADAQWPGPGWLQRAQAWLWWASKWTAGYPGLETLDSDEGSVLLDGRGLAGARYGYHSYVSETRTVWLTIRPGGGGFDPDPDPRSALGGDAIGVGDVLYILGNNCAADGRFRPIVLEVVGDWTERPWASAPPSPFGLRLSQDLGEAIDTALDTAEDHSVAIRIARERVEQPWERIRWSGEHVMWGVRQTAQWTTAEILGALKAPTLEVDRWVALPRPDRPERLRTFHLRELRNGEWTDITDTAPGVYATDGTGIVHCEPSPGAWLDLTWLDVTGLEAVEAMWFRDVSDQVAAGNWAGKPVPVGPRVCRHCAPDPSGTWGLEGDGGWRYVCLRSATASGIVAFEPPCWQVNVCDGFEEPPAEEWLDQARAFCALRQIWQGGYPVAIQERNRLEPLVDNTYTYERNGVASIEGLIRLESAQLADAGADRRRQVEGGQFCALTAAGVIQGVGWQEGDPEAEFPEAPAGEGALLGLMGGSGLAWDPQSLVSDLADWLTDDPTGEHRRQPWGAAWQRSGDFSRDIETPGPRLIQAPGNGYAGAWDRVLIGDVSMDPEAGLVDRADGQVLLGYWQGWSLTPCAAHEANWGAVIRLKPMNYPGYPEGSIQWGGGPIRAEVAAVEALDDGRIVVDLLPARHVYMRWFISEGEAHAAQAEAGTDGIGFWCGGNVVGLPEYARVRNAGVGDRISHAGEMVGARRGWALTWWDGEEATVVRPGVGGPWLCAIEEAYPCAGARFTWQGELVGEERRPVLIDGDSVLAGQSAYYYANAGGPEYSLAAGEAQGLLPAGFGDWGNRCDRLVVRDWEEGTFPGLIDGEVVGPGSFVEVWAGLTFLAPANGAALYGATLRWTVQGQDAWQAVSAEDWAIIDSANGIIAIARDAAEVIKAGGGRRCFRIDLAGARLGRTPWMRGG